MLSLHRAQCAVRGEGGKGGAARLRERQSGGTHSFRHPSKYVPPVAFSSASSARARSKIKNRQTRKCLLAAAPRVCRSKCDASEPRLKTRGNFILQQANICLAEKVLGQVGKCRHFIAQPPASASRPTPPPPEPPPPQQQQQPPRTTCARNLPATLHKTTLLLARVQARHHHRRSQVPAGKCHTNITWHLDERAEDWVGGLCICF